MTWEEYYDKFYEWSENTQVNKLSSVESLDPAERHTAILPKMIPLMSVIRCLSLQAPITMRRWFV